MDRKIESAELRMEQGETCRSGAFVKSVCEVRVRMRLGDTAAVTISESFETTELGEAWRDGVVRGFGAGAPLWTQLDEARALATASALDVAEKARREERERIAAMLAAEATTHRARETQVRPTSNWLASAHRWQAESFERIAAELRKDGAQ